MYLCDEMNFMLDMTIIVEHKGINLERSKAISMFCSTWLRSLNIPHYRLTRACSLVNINPFVIAICYGPRLWAVFRGKDSLLFL
jgi:hypothetical protein